MEGTPEAAALDEKHVAGVTLELGFGEALELAMDLHNNYRTNPTLGMEDK